MAETKIQSAVETCFLKRKTIHKQFAWIKAHVTHPLVNISRAFAAVASTARWKNVARSRFAAFRDWDNVIPSGSRINTTIRTQAVEQHCQEFRTLRRNGINRALARVGVLLNPVPVFGIVCVSLSLLCVDAAIALTVLGCDPALDPRSTPAAPTAALLALSDSLLSSGAIRHLRAVPTFSCPSVAPRGIADKGPQWPPFSTDAAVFESSGHYDFVVREGHAQAGSSTLQNTGA